MFYSKEGKGVLNKMYLIFLPHMMTFFLRHCEIKNINYLKQNPIH